MESVSAQGGLIHAILIVATITENGIGVLIDNSPKLIQLFITLSKSVHEKNDGFDLSTLNIVLKEKYKHRQLMTEGNFVLNYFVGYSDRCTLNFRKTDFFRLW